MKAKDFSQITITDIERSSTVARSTFYRLFDNLVDVLSYQCDKVFDETLKKYSISIQTPDSFLLLFIDQWAKNDALLETVFSINRLDILYTAQQKREDTVKKLFFKDFDLKKDSIEFLIVSITSALVGILSVWMKHQKKESANDLLVEFKRSIEIFYALYH